MKNSSSYSLNYHLINRILFKFLGVFILFDGVRNAFVYSEIFSVFRDLTIFAILFSFILSKNKININIFDPILYLIGFYLLLHLPISVLQSPLFVDYEKEIIRNYYPLFSFILHFRVFELFIFIVIFSYYKLLTGKTLTNYIRFLIGLLPIFIIFSIIAYFYEIPYFNFPNTWGRIAAGYPTLDAQVLIYLLISIIFVLSFKSKIKFYVILILLLVSILMQVTGTSIISLIFIFSFLLFVKQKHLKFKKLGTFITAIILVLFLFYFIKLYFASDFENVIWLMKNKLSFVTGEISENASYQNRIQHFSKIFEFENPLKLLFGRGLVLAFLNENNFFFLLTGMGLIGLLLYLTWIFYNLLFGLKHFNNGGAHLFVSISIFTLSSYSLLTSYFMPIQAIFAIHYVIARNNIKNEKV